MAYDRTLTNREIIESVKTLSIKRDELVVVGGAALQLYGIKLTNDIDVVLPLHTLFDKVRDGVSWPLNNPYTGPIKFQDKSDDKVQFSFPLLLPKPNDYGVLELGKITLMPAPNDSLYQASFEELHDEAVEIDDVLVSPPSRILEWKQAVGRSKDLGDIDLINQYLTSPRLQ